MSEKKPWEWVIKSKQSWLEINFRELFAYKDLLLRLVRKEFLLRYQQTLLGPVWVLIQPILTVIVYILIFNKIIKVPIPDVPPVLFYLSGITLWTLFSDVFSGTANIFLNNRDVFSKVYFPRLITPLSITLLHYIRFAIQLAFLLVLLFYFIIMGTIHLNFSSLTLIIPATILTSALGLGWGLIFSVITAKYRDLSNILNLIISLLMFVSPIFYSMDIVPQKVQWLAKLNPLSALFELFRYGVLGVGYFSLYQLLYSVIATLVSLLAGFLWFNHRAQKLMDVV